MKEHSEPSKEERKRLLIEMMKEDEKNGMYEEPDDEVIARFMGYVFKRDNTTPPSGYYVGEKYADDHSLPFGYCLYKDELQQFATSWDWLLHVWNAFKQKCWVTVGYTETFNDYWYQLGFAIFNHDIEKAHSIMADAIKWFNSQQHERK